MKRISRLITIAACIAALAPVAWHIATSLKTSAELSEIPATLLPHHLTLRNYVELFQRRPFIRYYLNSAVIASMSSLICIAAASLAAYRLARLRGRVRASIRSALLAMGLFPAIMFLFPIYELVRMAGLMNHPWALIVPYAALNLPFAIWLLTGSFEQIPVELEEAAAVDGLTQFQTYRMIVLPLAAPALITAGVLVFIFAWNEFMLALTFMNMETQKTVTLGVATLSGAFTYEIPLGNIAAGVVVSALPLILLLIVFQRRIVEGLTAGTLK